jgi:hypothetical protein
MSTFGILFILKQNVQIIVVRLKFILKRKIKKNYYHFPQSGIVAALSGCDDC